MKKLLILATLGFFSCQKTDKSGLQGTYKLLGSETIKGADTTRLTVDFDKNEMLKMFNGSHFSFFNHDKSGGKDSLNTVFVSGAGTYSLDGDKYTENLDFCNFREWEGKQFHFTLEIKGDTLIQSGEEVLPELGINQRIKETYLKIK
jgi:hypothetical protein